MRRTVQIVAARLRRVTLVSAVPLILCVGAAGCGDDAGNTTSAAGGNCPIAPAPVVVTVDQWGDIVSDLAGSCGAVTTIIKGDAGDPHDYEPTPADSATFGKAKLIVINGADYDHWSENAIDTLSNKPTVVDAGKVAGVAEGENPHLWYSPTDVAKVADAVTAELKALAPIAASFFDERHAEWIAQMKPYNEAVEALKAKATGKTYLATESVFDYMAAAVGMVNKTPQGYQNAAANESDPSPGDISAFETALRSGTVNVLIYNTQTEGAIPAQLRKVAETAKVPVVEVTETVKPGTKGFSNWQRVQLDALVKALG